MEPTPANSNLVPAPSGAGGVRWPHLHGPARAIERLVRVMDSALPIPGTNLRIGLDPTVGFILPGAGDAIGGAVSLSVMFLALQYRLPVRVLLRMVINIGVDAAFGAVPFAGDAFDLLWHSNDKNFELFMQHRALERPARMPLRYWLAVIALGVVALACLVVPIVLSIWLLSHLFGKQ